MATRGEFDSVWFTLTGLTANHPKVEYVVVDNTPDRDLRTEAITKASGGRYFHRPDLSGTSAPRSAVFEFAETDWVCCIDSHILLESGAVQALLDWIAANPNSSDLVQGPLVWDDGKGISSHWHPHPKGLWGTWATDQRVFGTEPFEIPQMGLGLWAMRKGAWVGFNPLFRGFGGEEGYTHEKVRQRGGKCLCLPQLRWRHKFRDTGGWHNNPPPPYPLRLEDHVFNLLVGHRELGIEATEAIYEDFGKRVSEQNWQSLKAEAEQKQPFGEPVPKKRLNLLGIWYSDCTAPTIKKSAQTVKAAAQQTRKHNTTLSAVTWQDFPDNPFDKQGEWQEFEGAKVKSHATILKQIRQATDGVRQWDGDRWEYPDAVLFLEHDVLYPEDYFDRIGDALLANPNAPVVSNLDYIGLCDTGWQRVRERHEPLHQLTVRWDHFQQNLKRAEADCDRQGWCLLEPEGDRSNWVRLAPVGSMPSVHINYPPRKEGQRFTSHGDVCYEPVGYSQWQSHWGPAANWFAQQPHLPVQPPAFKSTPTEAACKKEKGVACGCSADALKGVEELVVEAAATTSDFNQHVPYLKELAASCKSATELSLWFKAADTAICAGLPADGTFTSICSGTKPVWNSLRKSLGDRFRFRTENPATAEIEETDLLFIDTEHTADALLPLLQKHHSKVRKYLVVHCTAIYGERGDRDNKAGVLHALRTFCRDNTQWVVKYRTEENNGLLVLSKCEEDVKDKPSLWKQGMNFTKAMAKHFAGGRKLVSLEVLEERNSICSLCTERALDACSVCGCVLSAKLPLASEECGMVKVGKEPKWKAETEPHRLQQ
jgi:hypothetical protein